MLAEIPGLPCSPNGCLQQIAAKGLTIPHDVIAILLQGFVIRSFPSQLDAEASAMAQGVGSS
jgi:hypothetical protein